MARQSAAERTIAVDRLPLGVNGMEQIIETAMSTSKQYGDRLSDSHIASLNTPYLSVVRCRRMDTPCEAPIMEIPQSASYSVIVQLEDFPSHRLWKDRQLIHSGGHARHAVAITDLRDAYACQHLSPYDNVRVSISQDRLCELADQLFAQSSACLESRQGDTDKTMLHLVKALLPVLHRREPDAESFIEHMTLAIAAHLLRRYGISATARDRHLPVGGLSLSQFSRVKDYVRHHLGQPLSLASIAVDCGMSRATFARAFKRTTGMTAFAWVRAQRIEHAKRLLEHSEMTMAAISAQCGFADQSHFSRVFTDCIGVKPTQWRAQQIRRRAPAFATDPLGEAP